MSSSLKIRFKDQTRYLNLKNSKNVSMMRVSPSEDVSEDDLSDEEDELVDEEELEDDEDDEVEESEVEDELLGGLSLLDLFLLFFLPPFLFL